MKMFTLLRCCWYYHIFSNITAYIPSVLNCFVLFWTSTQTLTAWCVRWFDEGAEEARYAAAHGESTGILVLFWIPRCHQNCVFYKSSRSHPAADGRYPRRCSSTACLFICQWFLCTSRNIVLNDFEGHPGKGDPPPCEEVGKDVKYESLFKEDREYNQASSNTFVNIHYSHSKRQVGWFLRVRDS